MGSGIDAYLILLGSMYSIVSLMLGYRLFRMIYAKMNMRTFQFIFLVLCLMWVVMRSFWFFSVAAGAEQVSFINLIVYTSPIMLQFMVFSLLVLYYARTVYYDKWEATPTSPGLKKLFFMVYTVANFIMFALLMVIIILHGQSTFMLTFEQIYAGIVFIALATCMLIYSRRISHMMVHQPEAIATRFVPSADSMFSVVSLSYTLVFIFATRAIYDCISVDAKLRLYFEGTTSLIIIAFMMICWEIIPILVVLNFFGLHKQTRDAPSTTGADIAPLLADEERGRANQTSKEEYVPARASGPVPVKVHDGTGTSLTGSPQNFSPKKKSKMQPTSKSTFDNPNRYNSDDEEEKVAPVHGPAYSYATPGGAGSFTNPTSHPPMTGTPPSSLYSASRPPRSTPIAPGRLP